MTEGCSGVETELLGRISRDVFGSWVRVDRELSWGDSGAARELRGGVAGKSLCCCSEATPVLAQGCSGVARGSCSGVEPGFLGS